MINEQTKRLASILERRIPLLTQYSPGWQGFRDGVPATLRCGLFVNAYDEHPEALAGTFGNPEPPTSVNGIRFQTSVGGRLVAYAIRSQLESLIPPECFTSAAQVVPTSEGVARFAVRFELDKTTLDELVDILDPPPARPFPAVRRLRCNEKELQELEDFITVARSRNTSWATVPCGALGILIREVRDRRFAEKEGAK